MGVRAQVQEVESHLGEKPHSVWGRRSTDLKMESRGSLALGFGSANQRPPRESDGIHARGSE